MPPWGNARPAAKNTSTPVIAETQIKAIDWHFISMPSGKTRATSVALSGGCEC